MEKASKTPESILKEVFGYDSFRPLQKEIISNILSKKDTLAIMPTGGGKSLCYQIPALIFPGITIVVSPLIALMQDQVSALNEAGVNAVFLNSSLDAEQYRQTAEEIKNGEVKIIYASPEGLAAGRIKSILHSSALGVNCITIDEAHCISEWGHDFRPDYMEIASFREEFPEAVCLALTATATQQVREDIITHLNLKKPAVLVASFNRENIFLSVLPKRNTLEKTIQFIREHSGQSGIIYCFSRKQVDELTAELKRNKISALNYHAGLTDEKRFENQTKFIRDKVDVMVATVAFGMGINKPNVRFVIHYDLPKSLEQYYQEIGRAGRDGNKAEALLFYSPADIRKIRYFFDESADSSKAEKLLQGMIDYASSRKCRRAALLKYFGESYSAKNVPPECCCDICMSGPKLTDVTIPAQKLMSCIYRTDERYGITYLIDILLGSKSQRILDNGHDSLSTYGIGKELKKDAWYELANAMLDAGIIRQVGEYNVLNVTSFGRELLTTRDKIELDVQIDFAGGQGSYSKSLPKSRPAPLASDPRTIAIEASLRVWRKHKAEELNLPPYIIFGDKTLSDLALKKPTTRGALLAVHGIGEAKAQKMGDEIISVIREAMYKPI